MARKVNSSMIMKAMDWAYGKAVTGVPPLPSAQELAEEYLAKDGALREKVDRLIRWQNTKCATSGFLTGLGGIITLPVAIPSNISCVIFVQVRMVAAIAHMAGHDIRSDPVRTLVYACLTGNAAKDILKDAGIVIGKKLTEQAVKRLSREVITKINQRVGFRLLTKFGEKGAINLGRAVPLVGGLIGGTLDAVATNLIGNVARDAFVHDRA